MKKKNLVLLGSAAMLSLALAGSLGAVVTASAAEINQDTEDPIQTTVTYSVDTTWKLQIPESITVGGAEATVSASDVIIEQGAQFKVTVNSTNGWKVQGNSQSIEYELKKNGGSGDALTNDVSGNTVLTVEAGAKEGSESLKATLKNADDGKYSTGGDAYTDTLTFTVTDGTEG